MAFDQEKVTVSIEDQGEGFDYKKIVSEFTDNVDTLPAQRGLFIVHYLMDEMFFTDKGNKVTMLKYLHPEVTRVLQ